MPNFKKADRVCLTTDYLDRPMEILGTVQEVVTYPVGHPDNVYTQAVVLFDDGRRAAYILEDLNLVIEF